MDDRGYEGWIRFGDLRSRGDVGCAYLQNTEFLKTEPEYIIQYAYWEVIDD